MDPLSDVLALLKPRNYMSAGLDAGGDWAIRFPGPIETIKTGAVVSGDCWLAVDGIEPPMRLDAGDCFLLPGGRAFSFASDPALAAEDAAPIFKPVREGGIVTYGGGGGCFIVSSRFALTGSHADMLLAMLPPIVHLKAESDRAILRTSVERMMQELRDPQPGGALMVQHLAHIMLVQALRLHLARAPAAGSGWLFALADQQIGAAIKAMHADPARRWTLETLAGHAGMSRSIFALVFREKVGETPMTYLTRWRMLLAADRLARSGDPISVIAPSLGYESESAFSTAFKRIMGCAPRYYTQSRERGPQA